MDKVNIQEKLGLFQDYWSPKIVGQVNDFHVKLVKVKGDFVWHHHDHEDEMFLVLDGRLTVHFPDREIVLEKGEFLIIPKGMEHKPFAEEEVHMMLLEPAATAHTGNVEHELTQKELDWI